MTNWSFRLFGFMGLSPFLSVAVAGSGFAAGFSPPFGFPVVGPEVAISSQYSRYKSRAVLFAGRNPAAISLAVCSLWYAFTTPALSF